MIKMIPQGSVLCDMFCGVGPLSVQAAKQKDCRVLANDLNPDCATYLKKNIVINKVEGKVLPFNMDAREFAKTAVLSSDIPKEYRHFDHVYMNLPVDAVEFLDVFCGLYAKADIAVWNEKNLPMIHVYAFTEQDDIEEAKTALCDRINKIFEKYKPLSKEDILNLHQIRDVSAKSRMYAVSFRLSKEVAYGTSAVVQKKHHSEELPVEFELKKSKNE